MKKIALILFIIGSVFTANSQIVCSGISPSPIAGNYAFTWADLANGWGTPDFLIPGTFIQGDLMVAQDGTPGLSAQGIPLSNYGCLPLTNNLTGKIALVYRYDGSTPSTSCEFSAKALACQNAGAIGVIIVNREPGVTNMAAGAFGAGITIPVVMIDKNDGAALRAQMANGPVNMLIGNKTGLYANDLGIEAGNSLIAKSKGILSPLAQNGSEFNFEIGTYLSNYGSNDQTNVSISANIVNPSGSVVYSHTLSGIDILSGNGVDLYPYSTLNFPNFNLPTYQEGLYTLTYTVASVGVDNYLFDNTFSSNFTINDSVFSYASIDPVSSLPISTYGARANASSSFSSCIVLRDPNASRIGVRGLYFQGSTNDGSSLVGESVALLLYRWDDIFSDIYDPNIAFNNLVLVASGPFSFQNNLQDETVFGAFNTPVNLEDNQRYLACVQTFNPAIDFGYDENTNYAANQGVYYQPTAPVEMDGMYFAEGFGANIVPSIGLNVFEIVQVTIDTFACANYTSPSGQVYTESGTYQEIVQSVYGYDSIVTTLNLNITTFDNLNSQVQITPTNCSSPTGVAAVTLTSDTPAAGTTFYISEYFSGNANNKSIEIYNPTNQPIDLGASFPSPTGNSPSSSLVLSNSAGQLFSFPANTILPAFGTILVSSNSSIIPSDFYSSIVDGSDMSLGLFESVYVPILGTTISGTTPIDVASSVSNSTSIRNNSVTSYNATYTASEWNNSTFSSTILYPYSLGEHYNIASSDYHIEWTNGSLSNVLTGISDGVYTYNVVQNQTGCVVYTEDVIVPTTGNNFNPAFSSTQQLFTTPPFAVQFTNSTANLSNYNFTWNFGDGTTLNSNNSSIFHQYLYNGLYTVSLIATNSVTGCSDTTTITDYIFCTGGVTCTHTATISQQGPIQVCEGTDVWLSCNNDPSFIYQWRRNGINIPGNDNDSLLVTQSGNYTVAIYVNNCPVTSNGISVTINPLPSIPTITSTGTITSCSGGSLTLSAPAGLSSYSWNTGATTASISVTQSGNYTITVTNASGCARTSAPYVVNASFMSSPTICVVGMDSLTNENRIVWEKPLTAGIDSFYVYKETNVSDVYTKIGATDYPDLAVFLDQNSNPAVQAYRYKLTVLDTCGTETLLSDFHKTIHLTINAGVGGAWNLIWSHYEGLTFGSYNIYRGTDPTNISLLTTIQSNLNSYTDLAPPVGPVYYQIELVNPNSCDPAKVINYSVSRSNIVNNGVNGINALSNSTVHVYPNPTSKDVTLEITSELIGKDYFLTDNTGRIILKGQFRAVKETVNLEQLATGVYFIKIDNNAQLMHKIVKN